MSLAPNKWARGARCESHQCLEATLVEGRVAVRDSKKPEGSQLRFTAEAWGKFTGWIARELPGISPDLLPTAGVVEVTSLAAATAGVGQIAVEATATPVLSAA